MKKVLLALVQWAMIIATILLLWRFWFGRYLPHMEGGQVILFALALAFFWVEELKIGVTRPFTCMKCMTGWFAFLLAAIFRNEYWPLYLPLGVFVGAIFSAIKMRWL